TVVRVSEAKEGVKLEEGQGLGEDCALAEVDRAGDTVLPCDDVGASECEARKLATVPGGGKPARAKGGV
ncbi:MAG: hypothetical protein ACOYKF_10190, partial [Phenylobacterium sp.]